MPTPTIEEITVDPSVWERYQPSTNSVELTEDELRAQAPTICAAVEAGEIETGFLWGWVTGASGIPKSDGVRKAITAIQLKCPESYDDFVALLDAYDAKHGPY